jgi:DNA-directed RNA polymerase I subunit RPA49
MADRKRKASGQAHGRDSKKQKSTDAPLAITLADNTDPLPPVLAVALGLNAPSVPMVPYTRTGVPAVDAHSEMLLHSSAHPRMDFLANKDFANSSDALMDHYIGIYDPKSSSLRLVQANRLAIRATLRPSAEELKNDAAKKAYQTVSVWRMAMASS